ncbi:SHOCT domain-containing protein [Halorussus halobius]|uniref:SHOCT domain-containing protein n=1 Tax=Halorussus halobius TaxID=1710537 RepID=UPI0010921C88|nr:SHOCT domain-containing protein [Halorussus halobius]
MGLLDDRRVKLLVAGFLLSLFALVGVAAFGVLAVVSALLAPPAGTPVLVAMLEAVVQYLLAGVFVGGISVVFLVWLLVAAVRRASLPRNDRLADAARRVERHVPQIRDGDLSEHVAPTTEERIDDLKQRYVDGEITEAEYERELQALLRDEDADDDRVGRERGRTQSEYEFER